MYSTQKPLLIGNIILVAPDVKTIYDISTFIQLIEFTFCFALNQDSCVGHPIFSLLASFRQYSE